MVRGSINFVWGGQQNLVGGKKNLVRGSTNLVRGPAGPKKLPQSLVGLICFTQNFVNYFGSQKRVFLASTGPQCKSWQASLQWDAQSGLLPPLGNLLLYRTKYCPISQTLQRETFLSFVNALSYFAILQQTQSKLV